MKCKDDNNSITDEPLILYFTNNWTMIFQNE